MNDIDKLIDHLNRVIRVLKCIKEKGCGDIVKYYTIIWGGGVFIKLRGVYRIDIDSLDQNIKYEFIDVLDKYDNSYLVYRTWHGYWIDVVKPVNGRAEIYRVAKKYRGKIGLFPESMPRIIPKNNDTGYPLIDRLRYDEETHRIVLCIYDVYLCISMNY